MYEEELVWLFPSEDPDRLQFVFILVSPSVILVILRMTSLNQLSLSVNRVILRMTSSNLSLPSVNPAIFRMVIMIVVGIEFIKNADVKFQETSDLLIGCVVFEVQFLGHRDLLFRGQD